MKFLGIPVLIYISVLFVQSNALALGRGSGAAGRESLARRRQINPCDLPSLPNGKVMRRQRGKMLQYQCNSPFKLIGSKYATCHNRHWDSPVPICAKSGCPDITTVMGKHHMVFYELNKVMVSLRCRSEYVLKGASIAYCDGENWDRALGSCHETVGLDNLSCDFESDDLCGWSHDENEDFRWARHSGQPLTLRQRTGPRTDHTVGRLHEGHYMLLESFEHEEGDQALLFSPIYSAEKSKDSCFRFFYHMYGLLVGSLRVYVKPVSVDSDTLLVEPKYRFFDQKGNQRNIWHEGRFAIEELQESFQIIFEGVLRSSLFGDIAIDDVELLQGEECLPDVGATTTEEAEVEMEDNFSVILSCEDRCGEQRSANKTGSCDCHSECADTYSCCPDFLKVCGSTQTPPPATTTRTTTIKRNHSKASRVTMDTTTKGKSTLQEFVEPVTSYKIIPKALDNELPPGLEIVSMHKTVIFVSIIGCLTIIVTMLLVRHFQKRRRLLDPEFYKRGSDSGNASQSAREEFSEIRYLTEDDHLDFSLASPSSFRPQVTQLATEPNAGKNTSGEQHPANVFDQETDDEDSEKQKKGKNLAILPTVAKNRDCSNKASTPKNGKKAKFQKKAYNDDDPDNEGLLGQDEEDW